MKSPIGEIRTKWANHRERSRPTGIGFAISDSIRYLDAPSWDSLVHGHSIFMSRKYLVALEESGVTDVHPRYALLFEGKRPVAAFTAQILRCHAEETPEVPPDAGGGGKPAGSAGSSPGKGRAAGIVKRATSIAHRVKDAVTMRLKQRAMSSMLLTGNAFSWTSCGVAFAEGEDPARLWPAVAEGLLRIRRADRLKGHTDLVVVKDIPGETLAHATGLERFSYRQVRREPDMVLEFSTEWRTEQDYLGDLSSKYRKAAVSMDRELAGAGVVLEALGDVASRADRIHELYLSVRQRAKVRGPALPAGYFPALQGALGDRFRLSVLRRGDEILGFVSTIQDGPTAVGYLVGVDYEANSELPIYLRLLRAVIADGLAMGCRRVSYGGTALEPKSRLGARPVPLTLYVRHRNPVINVMFRDVLSAVQPDEAPDRNPFKS